MSAAIRFMTHERSLVVHAVDGTGRTVCGHDASQLIEQDEGGRFCVHCSVSSPGIDRYRARKQEQKT